MVFSSMTIRSTAKNTELRHMITQLRPILPMLSRTSLEVPTLRPTTVISSIKAEFIIMFMISRAFSGSPFQFMSAPIAMQMNGI